jgi:hypothetical protein
MKHHLRYWRTQENRYRLSSIHFIFYTNRPRVSRTVRNVVSNQSLGDPIFAGRAQCTQIIGRLFSLLRS